MLKLKKPWSDPPGGWRYNCGELKNVNPYTIKAGQFKKLVDLVEKHLKINKHHVPDNLAEMIEDQICRSIPSSLVVDPYFDRKIPKLDEQIQTTKLMARAIRKQEGGPLKDIDADPRKEICVSCVFNQNHIGCWKCEQPYKYSNGTVGDVSNLNNYLTGCDIFACANMLHAHATKETIRDFYSGTEYILAPDSCWIVEILEGDEA